MDDSDDIAATPWSGSRSAKEKNDVRRSVTALLDELAPEKVLKRVEQVRGTVEQYRTPNGCVLQAPNAAVSVSWFAPADNDPTLGELQIIVWRGKVARRGTPQGPTGAKILNEIALRPIEKSTDECVWRTSEGVEYDTVSLANHCVALLEEQITA